MSGESRQELVNWVNSTLQLDITKVDDCGKGYVYCQLLDSIHRDVPLKRVNFGAKNEYDYLSNFKILQSSFTAHAIERPIDMGRLVKCRLQDNLEFLQWFKRYWDSNFPGGDYDPVAARNGRAIPAPTGAVQRPSSSAKSSSGRLSSASAGRPGSASSRPSVTGVSSHPKPRAIKPMVPKGLAPNPRLSTSNNARAPAATTAGGPSRAPVRAPVRVPSGRAPASSSPASGTSRSSSVLNNHPVPHSNRNNNITAAAAQAAQAAAEAAHQQNEQLQLENQETKQALQVLENDYNQLMDHAEMVTSEREFYFSKLREIEILMQSVGEMLKQKEETDQLKKLNSDSADSADENGMSEVDNGPLSMLEPEIFIKAITDILYSTTEGFEAPNESLMEIDEDDTMAPIDDETF